MCTTGNDHVDTKPRGIEATCFVSGDDTTLHKLILQATKTFSERGCSDFMCMHIKTHSMTGLVHQKHA